MGPATGPSPAPWLPGRARVQWTGREQGDLRRGRDSPLPWAPLVDRPVSCLRQVHSASVAVVERPGGCRGREGDALVTTHPGAALAVLTADCAPVALSSPEGVIGAAHAGWSGLLQGVIEETVATMSSLGATRVVAALGPCIHPECYEFGVEDLDRVAARLGDQVRATTRAAAPALDLPAAVASALRRAGAELVHDEHVCTACAAERYFSRRARGEPERQAMVVWRD